jgi:hypothetical protein
MESCEETDRKNEIPMERISDWEEIGMLSFSRFYDLTMEETIAMINNPNETLYGMVEEIKQSMLRYENFMVKVRRIEEEGEEWTRLDFLDFSQ